MKQFLIVLLATAAVFVGWRVYSGPSSAPDSKSSRRELAPTRPPKDQRPKTGGRTPRGKASEGVKVEVFDPDTADQSQKLLEERLAEEGSWTQFVQEADTVRLEDAWHFDFGNVDYDAPVLTVVESPSGVRVEVTQNDWRRYLCLTLASSLVRTELLAKRGRVVAESFGETYGFSDDEWALLENALAKSKGRTVDEYRFEAGQTYGLPEEAAMLVKRHSMEGIMAHLPRVSDASQLPQFTRKIIEDPEDRPVLMTVAAGIREGRKNIHDPDEAAALAGMIETGFVMFTRSMPDYEFQTTWSFLDGEMPSNGVAACVLGEIQTEELQPPWLQPGEIAYVTVDEVWPHVPDLSDDQRGVTSDQREGLLRELIWFMVLRGELEQLGHLNTPEETWSIYADEYTRRNRGILNLSAHSSAVARFPSTYHYRAFSGVFWSFKEHQEKGWDAEENLRAFYDRNRVFIEAWTQAVEVILFPAMKFEDGLDLDWEEAHRIAEESRARVLAGEEDFTEMRNRLHSELRERLIKLGLHEVAQKFDEAFQNGMLAGRMSVIERSLSESPFEFMIDTASVTRNAVARLDPGEISPVWRVPNGYAILRVHGVTAADLEGTFEDNKGETRNEYSRAHFRKWANDILRNSKLSN